MKIRGHTVGTTMPRADYAQNDPKKADYIKNKPDLAAFKTEIMVEVGKKASTASYPGTLTAAGWSDAAPYTQTITVPGILGTDEPWVDIDMSKVPADVDAEEAWNFVGRVTASADNTIVAYCNKEKPEVDLPIILKVVR